MQPNKDAQIARSAGTSAQLMGKEGKYAILRMPSGEMRYVLVKCKATIGRVGNINYSNVTIGKAGRTRHMGIRPSVRGVAMNPIDHPHGGGEGKSPIGMPTPVSPWGQPALGYKTRKKKSRAKGMIIKRIN
jgi:large subunit ribosomal protein L2